MTKARELGDNAQNTKPKVIDAKGDLIVGTGSDAADRLAVGSNGETIVADSSATTGLRWQGLFAAGKNKIINGDFNINQRGFSSTTTDNTYGFDRWKMRLSGATGTYSAETYTLGTAPVTGYEAKNFARLAITTGNDFSRIEQWIESVRTFAGQTVTLSFWAKGTNPTTAGNLKAYMDQYFGTGGSPSSAVNIAEQTFVLTANWTRYSLTFSIPSISGKTLGTDGNDALILIFGQGTSASNDSYTLDIWGVQLEAGSVATPFQTATGTLAGELAACQRYYYRNSATGAYSVFSPSNPAQSTTALDFAPFFPVTMRIAPTSIEYSNIAVTDNNSLYSTGTFVLQSAGTSTSAATIRYTHGTAALTQFRPYFAASNNSTSGYLAFNAEL